MLQLWKRKPTQCWLALLNGSSTIISSAGWRSICMRRRDDRATIAICVHFTQHRVTQCCSNSMQCNLAKHASRSARERESGKIKDQNRDRGIKLLGPPRPLKVNLQAQFGNSLSSRLLFSCRSGPLVTQLQMGSHHLLLHFGWCCAALRCVGCELKSQPTQLISTTNRDPY